MVLADLIERIRGECLDVADLRLSAHPAQGLWHMEPDAWNGLLRRLTAGRLMPGDADVPAADDEDSSSRRGSRARRPEDPARR